MELLLAESFASEGFSEVFRHIANEAMNGPPPRCGDRPLRHGFSQRAERWFVETFNPTAFRSLLSEMERSAFISGKSRGILAASHSSSP